MKIGFKTLSISLLWMAGAMSAFANPGQRQAWREATRSIQLAPAMEQGESGGPQGQRVERVRTRERELEPPASSGAQAGQGNGASNTVQEESHKPGRMTPEERRALRRQINDAGRDIYAPGH